MLMSLGSYVFSIPTLAFSELQRKTSWRHATSARVGARPAGQFLGAGDDLITLSGSHLPGVINQQDALKSLRELADKGDVWPLVDGSGAVYGAYVIENLDEATKVFTDQAVPVRTDFTLSLRRMDDDAGETQAGWFSF